MIKLSKKGGYAIKAVIYVAKSKNIVNIIDISKSENISESLLRRIIADLDKSKILLSIKGRNGGIKIGKELKDISIFDILNSVDEELGITDCTKGMTCINIESCTTTKLLGNLQKSFNGILKLNTLDKII